MAAKLLEITEGWSAEIGPIQALSDGVGFALTDYTCTAIVTDSARATVASAATVRKHSDQTTYPGYWYFTPDPTKWLTTGSPYYIHLKLVDGSSKVAFFPNGEAMQVVVNKP